MAFPALLQKMQWEIHRIAGEGTHAMSRQVRGNSIIELPKKEYVLPSAVALVGLQAVCLGDFRLLGSQEAAMVRSHAFGRYVTEFFAPVYHRGISNKRRRDAGMHFGTRGLRSLSQLPMPRR